MTPILRRYRWHFLFWSIYCIGWSCLSVFYYHSTVQLAVAVTLSWFLGQAMMIYLTIYRWVPRYLRLRRIALFLATVVLTTIICAVFTALVSHALMKAAVPTYTLPLSTWFVYVLFGNVYWIFLTIGFVIIRDRFRNERRIERKEKEHAENELRFLKSQMNPHFLFNAINSIYVLIKKDPDLAEHTLGRFSDMLRYQLYDCATDYIHIEKEITYLENYLRLEQLRKGSMLVVDFQVEESCSHFSIAPLLLMPLVENAFKWVSSFTDRENRIFIRLSFDGGQFRFGISNMVDPPGAGDPGTVNVNGTVGQAPSAGGIGLGNVRRRLELLYPSRHSLEIDKGSEYFTVNLKLQV
jgi:two-component system, LytTR family, sensor kinase